MGFLNWLMLAGLAGVSIPIIIHLLNRRRYVVVDWGAMQFLKISEVTRRRLLIEEIILMLIRMGLIAILVLALAGPFLHKRIFKSVGTRESRDIVIVFDGSASMGAIGAGENDSPHEKAQEWANEFVKQLQAGDTVALMQAKQQVIPIVPERSIDLARVRDKIATLPPPGGGADLPRAVQEAKVLLGDSERSGRDIIVLTDGQRQGWADPTSELRWGLLANEAKKQRRSTTDFRDPPRIFVVNLDPQRKKDLPNYSLPPLRVNRPIVPVGLEVMFRCDLQLTGHAKYEPPHRLNLAVDGRSIRDLKVPENVKLNKGKVPFSFKHRFNEPGSHLVSVELHPDPAKGDRDENHKLKDHVPSDNRQDFALEVVSALPVLLVDGDTSIDPRERSTDFLQKALQPKNDPHPVVNVRVVSIDKFTPEMLTGEEGGLIPRVLVLSNVGKVEQEQSNAIARFLAQGGGVLVTLGEKVERDAYNSILYRDGQGWLPAKLDRIEGDEANVKDAVHPVPSTSTHPVLELFREDAGAGGLVSARFPRWWSVNTPGQNAPGVTVATLRSPSKVYPFFVERFYRAGRVLLCTVPLDTSWNGNLPRLPAFVPLAHEMVYYLAGARSSDFNLQPGQPIRYHLKPERNLNGFHLQVPFGGPEPVTISPGNPGKLVKLHELKRGSQMTYDDTRLPGVYRLFAPQQVLVFCKKDEDRKRALEAGAYAAGSESLMEKVKSDEIDFDIAFVTRDMLNAIRPLEPFLAPKGLYPASRPRQIVGTKAELSQRVEEAREQTVYYVVQTDGRESDLTPATEEERTNIATLFPMEYENESKKIIGSMETVEERPEIWWWFLLFVIGFLCVEVWMTRRMALNR